MTQASNRAAERFCTACTPSRCRRVVKSAHNLRNRKAMPQAPDTRERSDSTELVLYDPWCGLLPRHPLLSSYFLTLAVEPRVVTDCVPIVHSYMQPLQLLKSACVCKDLCRNQPVRRVHGDDASVLARSSGEEPASPRHQRAVKF